MPDPASLARLCHHRWSVPVLAELRRDGGCKFVTLVHRLEAPRGAVSEAVEDLVALGLIAPNPGYGHPLRPEFVLTERGGATAPACLGLWDQLRRRDLVDLGLRKWPMATLLAVHQGGRRFGELRGRLPGVTDRALSLALVGLQEAVLVTRAVLDRRPVGVVYEPAPATLPLRQVLAAFP